MSVDETTRLTKEIKTFAMNILPPGRFAHSLRTAKMCKKLCVKFKLDAKSGFLAGLAHDLCKSNSDETMVALAKRDGFPFSQLEEKKPSLLHGRAAAVLLKEKFGVENEDVLDAVRWHTFGRRGLCLLGRALFVADKMEPGRKGVSKRMRREVLSLGFLDMVGRVIENNVDYLMKTGKIIAPETLEMFEEIKAEKKKSG